MFSYRLLHSFLLSPGPQKRKTDNSLLVAKHIIGEIRDFKIVGGSIKMGGGIFTGVGLTPLVYYEQYSMHDFMVDL